MKHNFNWSLLGGIIMAVLALLLLVVGFVGCAGG